jgi:hypothetical protein
VPSGVGRAVVAVRFRVPIRQFDVGWFDVDEEAGAAEQSCHATQTIHPIRAR